MGYVDASANDDHILIAIAREKEAEARRARERVGKESLDDQLWHRKSTYNGSESALKKLQRRRIR